MSFLSTKAKIALIFAGAVSLLTLGLVASIGRDGNDAVATTGGVVLGEALPRPGFVLTTTAGDAYDFRTATEGKAALLFFGYMNCPDICPMHLANIASAMRSLTPAQRERLEVVFVTVDPARDQPASMRRFLDRFDPSFVGLTGEVGDVITAQQRAGVAVAVLGEPDGKGNYDVGHAAQVIAYGPDGPARRVYPFGVTLDDWRRDLPRLVEGELS